MTPAGFKPSFEIGGRWVGGDAQVLIIAEAGINHFGDLGKALALVDLAAEAGADVCKTQTFSTDHLVASTLPEWRARLRPKEVGLDFLARMKARCEERGILFLCTPHDETALCWLDELDVAGFKVGSGERGNLPYFRAIASRGKPVILSTGMYREADVVQALDCFAEAGCTKLALLHCVSSYPTPYGEVNLRAMDALRALFPGPVGYSDHTDGHHAVLAAVARGAAIVEKHITLDFDVPDAQDWKVSAGPDDLADLVRRIREVQSALGDGIKAPQRCETAAEKWALKSLVAARDLAIGTVLKPDMIVAKRAGYGLSPARLGEIVGRKLTREVATDKPFAWDHFAQ